MKTYLQVKFLFLFIAATLMSIAGYFIFIQPFLFDSRNSNSDLEINKKKGGSMTVKNFEDCLSLKDFSISTFPGQVERCQTLEGEIFIKSNEKSNSLGNLGANFSTSRFSDMGDHYFISIPSDWKLIKENGPRGVQISYLEFTSPDFRTHSSDCGPSDCIYYDKGMWLAISIENSKLVNSHAPESIKPNPNKLIIQKKFITINSVEAAYYKFQEPSTSAGILLNVQFFNNSNEYYIHAAYNPETYPDGEEIFKIIIQSFQSS